MKNKLHLCCPSVSVEYSVGSVGAAAVDVGAATADDSGLCDLRLKLSSTPEMGRLNSFFEENVGIPPAQ